MPEENWAVDANAEPSEIVGPCGCRLPNTDKGRAIAAAHHHLKDEEPQDG